MAIQLSRSFALPWHSAAFLTTGDNCDSIEFLRYRLFTLLIVLSIGPPALAGVWWWYMNPVPIWILAVSLVVFLPDLIIAAYCYGFGGLCHLIGRLPGGSDRMDTKF